jgi:hypothetical protein
MVGAGTCTIMAMQGGDSNWTAAVPVSESVTLMTQDSPVTLISSANPSIVGQNVTLTAIVAGQSPTGTVTFQEDSTMCQAALSGGITQCQATFWSPGQHSFTAVYSGDANNSGSVSAVLTQNAVVGTNIRVSASRNPSNVGDRVTFFANVYGQLPTGTVTFRDGSTVICAAAPLSYLASCDTTVESVGTHTITATYSGDGNNSPAVSTGYTEIVTWNVSTTSGYGGWVSIPLNPYVTDGGSTIFTITPDTGYTIDTVSGSTCVPSLQSGITWTTGAITANCVIKVTFSGGFVSLNPARILDTRTGSGTIDGQFAGIGAATAGGVVDLTVAGRGGLPSTGVVAVVLNVTATNPTAPGYVTAWPSATPQPFASNLNFAPGKTIPNLVIAKLGANGKVSLYNSAGTTDLIADVAGYFGGGTDLHALSPARLLDTRAGSGTIDGQFQGKGAVPAGGTLKLMIGGRDGIPLSGIGAAILNVTAVQPTAPGYLSLWPSDAAQPFASNLNFMPGDTVPNLVISKVSASGEVSIYNSAGDTDVIADVAGWFPSSSQLTPMVPARIMDTRPGASTVDGQAQRAGALQGAGSVNLTVLDRGGVPTTGVSAVVLNVTVTDPTAPGYLTVWPAGSSQPLASNLNFIANQTIANLVIAKVGTNGQVAFYNGSTGTSQVVVDVVGWFAE